MYTYNFVLKRVSPGSWTLLTDTGNELYTFNRVSSPEEAMQLARAWASSWTSVSIKYDEEETRDRVHNEAQ